MNVQEPAKLATDLFERSGMLETSSFVEMEASSATVRYLRDQRTEAKTSRLCDNGPFEFTTDAAAPEFGVHIKRSLARVLVGRAFRPRTQTSPTDHLAVDLRDDDGMAFAVFAKPSDPLADCLRLGIKRRGRGEDRLVVDFRDR